MRRERSSYKRVRKRRSGVENREGITIDNVLENISLMGWKGEGEEGEGEGREKRWERRRERKRTRVGFHSIWKGERKRASLFSLSCCFESSLSLCW